MVFQRLVLGSYLLVALATDCPEETCQKRGSGTYPTARGVSLLQAVSRNKSAAKNATAADLPNSSATDSIDETAPCSNSSTVLGDVVKMADTIGGLIDSARQQNDTAGNETGYLSPEQNLSNTSVEGVNYSLEPDEEVIPPEPERPYEAAVSNSSQDNSSVVKVHPIKGASPMPEPDPQTLTDAMKDCIMADWGEWSDCLTDNANGYAGPHQQRERSIVQPYLPGGEPCGLTMEARTCQLVSAANTLVNLA